MAEQERYGVAAVSSETRVAAPELNYRPAVLRSPPPKLALIGCGGISEYHLRAYSLAGYEVVALVDRKLSDAEARRDEFFPTADVYTDYRKILERNDVGVVDLATHPDVRLPMYRPILDSGKHILSQKPFVTDIAAGVRICDYAAERGLKLAVNQNGRWAPHFRYMTEAIEAGLIGDVVAVHMNVTWDHSWIGGTPFEEIDSLIFYDFGIHWFDMITVFMGDRVPTSVMAQRAFSRGQIVKPPMLSQCIVKYADAQASVTFNGSAVVGQEDHTVVVGTKGMLTSIGPDLLHQTVHLYRQNGIARPVLESHWFAAGFHGTMAELLSSIEDERAPCNEGRRILKSLQLCFAAVRSAAEQRACTPERDGLTLPT